MEIVDLKLLVVGASGAIGGELAAAAAARGARVAVAGRDPQRLAHAARRARAGPGLVFDAYDLEGGRALGPRAVEQLGGLDAVLVAIGAVAFGHCSQLGPEMEEHLMTVNALAPMAVLEGALPLIGPGGSVGAITGVIVDRPLGGAAAYRASKAALSAWLDTARVEYAHHGVSVLDARLPHLDTGFADRALAGSAPPLPPGADLDSWVGAVLDALVQGAAVLAPSGRRGEPAASPPTTAGRVR
ncbi:SDR family NAD(P)-dependent oxidoreductase [Kitasatospora purpeofusca]|uniref:SDR family NAD(P)-dependent oxidoreductase n=1 Tax=Kitasatospora purpeofusca TaxID=67352 RepID=UPI00068F82A0|nr:SDR family NAD(P)-dependent oxidoreductase [Kitasatospora purpeofusca]